MLYVIIHDIWIFLCLMLQCLMFVISWIKVIKLQLHHKVLAM